LAAAIVMLVTVWRLSVVLPRDAGLNHVSGVWVTQAQDLSDGVFYRPLVSAQGYGGTRMMPLHFVLHAAMMRLGVGVITAGYLISLASAIGLTAGMYALLRRLGAGHFFAGACSVFWLGTLSGQFAVTTIRGDILPAAMNVWGLVFCLPSRKEGDSSIKVLYAAAFFALAFVAKLMTLFGFAGAFAALLLQGRKRQAFGLMAATGIEVVFLLALIYVASEGRWLDCMLACATGGGDARGFIHGLLQLLRQGRDQDLFALMMWVTAVAAVFSLKREDFTGVVPLTFLATGAVTATVFGSPGVSFNHLLDLNVIALALVAGQIARSRLQGLFAIALLSVLAAMGSVFSMARLARTDSTPKHAELLQVVHIIDGTGKPVLSENALVPFFRGERAYMMDPFMFRVLCLGDPSVRLEFLRKLDNRDFAGVVLQYDPRTEDGRSVYGKAHFCEGFAEKVIEKYPEAVKVGGFFVFLPEREDEKEYGD